MWIEGKEFAQIASAISDRSITTSLQEPDWLIQSNDDLNTSDLDINKPGIKIKMGVSDLAQR